MGWSTQVGGTDERSQAQLLARCYLAAVASGVCQNMSWYDFRSDGNDPFYNEHNFGIIQSDLTLKPGYRALRTVCRTFTDGTPRRREDFGAGVFALEMGGKLALWSPSSAVEVTCRVSGETPHVVNLMGDSGTAKRDGDRLTLTLKAGCPLFVSRLIEPTGEVVPLETPHQKGVLRF
jgi:hypothetical protein